MKMGPKPINLTSTTIYVEFKKTIKTFQYLIESIYTDVFFDVKLIGFGPIFIHPFVPKI